MKNAFDTYKLDDVHVKVRHVFIYHTDVLYVNIFRSPEEGTGCPWDCSNLSCRWPFRSNATMKTELIIDSNLEAL